MNGPLSDADQTKYSQQVIHLAGLPALPGHTHHPVSSGAQASTDGTRPSYQVAPVSRDFEGIDTAQSGCSNCEPPNVTLTTNSGFTIEGACCFVFSIYDYAGALQAGPIQYATLFASVLHNGDSVFDPQTFYDSGTGRWINMIIETVPGPNSVSIGYYDVAISANGNPLGSWYIYQLNTLVPGTAQTSAGDWGDFPLVGVDQAGLWLTGTLIDSGPCLLACRLPGVRAHAILVTTS